MQTHESYRLSKSYSSLLAQQIAHRVREGLTEFYVSCNPSSRINMFDVREKFARGIKLNKINRSRTR